jgi:hypothetical protein
MAADRPDLVESWRTSLDARNRSASTIDRYLLAVRRCRQWLGETTRSSDVGDITRRAVNGFVARFIICLLIWVQRTG